MFGWLDQAIKVVIEKVIGLTPGSRAGQACHFFLYDIIKISFMLAVMVFVISYVRSYFPAERTKRILGRFKGPIGNLMAALLGIVTPFCSCSSVPLFIGFVEAGIPLGLTFSFLITSPIVNEAAFVVLLASFGPRIAVLYVLTGVVVGMLGGLIIGGLKVEDQVESYVYQMSIGQGSLVSLSQVERIRQASDNVRDIFKRVGLFLIIGIGIGAAIHGWLPADWLADYAGTDNPVAVIVAVVFGIPLYSNALGTIPIADALIDKGVGIGTALSFMMATTALSLPELLLLKKVIKPKLIFYFIGITGLSIIMVGYLFNALANRVG